MTITSIVDGDITTASVPIAHQCNCVTKSSAGVARTLFSRIDGPNPYCDGTTRTPGTISFTSDRYGKMIINMFAQYGIRKSDDCDEPRELWFKECLNKILEAGIELVAMPYNIGCGLAGGNWSRYSKILEEHKLNIMLYKL